MAATMEEMQPFRGIRTIDDLQLAHERIDDPPQTVLPDEAYYPELCTSLTLRLTEHELFGGEPRMLLEAADDAPRWRLLLTEHGYLRFEADGDDAPALDSIVPIHAIADPSGPFRVGLSLLNYGWLLRDTAYAAEAAGYSHAGLLVSRDATSPLREVGRIAGWQQPMLAPAPRRLRVGVPGELSGWNCAHAHTVIDRPGPAADDVLPLVRGGSSFEPRRVDEDTVDVFTRPEFTRTSSYWVLLHVREVEPMPRRIRVRTATGGAANMTPTFFASSDRRDWRRVLPETISMREDGADLTVEFDARALAGRWLASGPVFGERERRALLEWSRDQPHTTVREIGRSVQNRPLHLIRVGARSDGQADHGVVILCGQHSPLEIMTAHTLRPLMAELAERPALLDRCTFYLVPTVNADCAHFGGNGLNANARNLNRHWFTDVQPENAAVIEALTHLRRAGQPIDLGIDMHAGGVFRNHVLMHMADGPDITVAEDALTEQQRWRDLLERHAGLRRIDGRPLAGQRLRATDYLHQVCGATPFCLELSSCSFFDPRRDRTRAFTTDTFALLGEGIAAACEERFCGGSDDSGG